jgi:hypothetical protein
LVLPDGLHAYVEPENLMRVGDDLVVAGSPSYTWAVGGDTARVMSTDAYVAAYLDETEPRLVARPVSLPIGMVRTVALDGRRWGMLFTEGEPSADGTAEPLTFVALYYAEYDGAGWSTPEPVPVPEGEVLFPESSSPLVRVDDRLHWVVVRGAASGEALHYERHAGTWTVETVEARGAEAAGLAAGPSGLWAVLSGFGLEASESKSVRLFHHEDSGWRLVTRDVTVVPYTEILRPSVVVGPRGATLSWTEARGAGVVMARVGVGPESGGTPLTIDGSGRAVRTFSTASGEPRWALWHDSPVPGADQLRVVRVEASVVETDKAVPYPYTGYFAAAAEGPDQVVVTGSEFSPDPARPTVRSLTLRLNPSCQ